MLKIFLTPFFTILFLLSGFISIVSAHGPGPDETAEHNPTMMKMNKMIDLMMRESATIDCARMNSAELIEKGENLMSKMMANDEEKHKRMEEEMEKVGGGEFHDMMHIMMGRMASGCFTDEQQKAVATKLTAIAPQRTNQTLPLATGIVIGLLVGLVGMSFFKMRS